jgi:hypothetical protein
MNSIFFSFSQNEIKLAQRQSQFYCKNAKNKKILEMAEVWTLSGGKEKKAKLLLQHKLVEKQTF